jgi:hypothetical protein
MEAAMRKPEPVDEFAETEVLVRPEQRTERDTDALSLYAEYETELARDAGHRHGPRTRR